MERHANIKSCTQLQSKYIQSIFNYFTINEISEFTNKLLNRTLFIIYQNIYSKYLSLFIL